jgi:hypothetical protein
MAAPKSQLSYESFLLMLASGSLSRKKRSAIGDRRSEETTKPPRCAVCLIADR